MTVDMMTMMINIDNLMTFQNTVSENFLSELCPVRMFATSRCLDGNVEQKADKHFGREVMGRRHDLVCSHLLDVLCFNVLQTRRACIRSIHGVVLSKCMIAIGYDSISQLVQRGYLGEWRPRQRFDFI